MKFKSCPKIAALAAALALVGCGGGGSDDGGNNGGGTTEPTNKFTRSGELVFPLTAGASLCYDLDTEPATLVDGCTGTAWDIKITGDARGLTGSFWTNSGPSGSGAGGAFGGPFAQTWAELLTYQQGTVDPVSGTALPASVYTPDAVSGVFSASNSAQSAAFEYAVSGSSTDHNLYPNFRVFLVTADSAQASAVSSNVYALQITDYYSAAGASGHPTVRWVKRDGSQPVTTKTLNAASGWVYLNLDTGALTTESETWHIAFNRLQVKLNGGSTNPSGTVAGFLGLTPEGFYDAQGNPVASKFLSPVPTEMEALLTSSNIAVPATARNWISDANGSTLNPAYTGSYPNPLNYGWFSYYPTAAAAEAVGLVQHQIKANPDNGSLIRSGEGTGYARIHLKDVSYADPTSNASQQTWTIGYDVQPSTN